LLNLEVGYQIREMLEPIELGIIVPSTNVRASPFVHVRKGSNVINGVRLAINHRLYRYSAGDRFPTPDINADILPTV
jgi:hypothetical protein